MTVNVPRYTPIGQLPFRIKYLAKTLRRRLRLWRERRRTIQLLQIVDREQVRSDQAWERLNRMRTKRKRDHVRRELQSINRFIGARRAEVEAMLALIEKEDVWLRTLSRWLWQGYVDDRDGPPERILNSSENE